ncbi:MAG: polysaccharide deacetylase family protein [Actinomycetota bacterium]
MNSQLRVALTFDAEHPDRSWCPRGNAERILDTLQDQGVLATFFVQGRWAEAEPALARRIADAGHLVGHHSHYHARLPLLRDAGIDEDLADGRSAIVEATGRDPKPWFRCPFGAGHDDARVLARIEAAGYRDVHWDVELEDWEPHRSGPAIAESCLDGVRTRGDGAVVLLHTWPGGTADALAPIVTGLRDMEATFVTIDELDRLP